MAQKDSLGVRLIIMTAVVALLAPLSVTAYAQTQGENSEGLEESISASVQENVTGIDPDGNSVGPVGVVDEYIQAKEEISEWFLQSIGEPPAVVEGLPITGVGVAAGIELFIGVDQGDADRLDEVKEKFQILYPELNIVVDTLGPGEWMSGSSMCTSTTDDCSPQLAGMRAYGLNTAGSLAEPFTITLGHETNSGKKGFLAPKHSFGLDDTGNYVYRHIVSTTPIGKHGEVLINTGYSSPRVLDSDTVFVEFDKKHSKYIETVKPLTIYSEDEGRYSVVGTSDIDRRDRVSFSGYVRGEIDTIVLHGGMDIWMLDPFDSTRRVLVQDVFTLYSRIENGDSGAPVYMKSNANNEVSIVGSMSGNIQMGTVSRGFGFHWDQISDDLNLRSIR